MDDLELLHQSYEVRGWTDCRQTIERTLGDRVEVPLVKAASAVRIKNPFAGVHQEDLSSLTASSAVLGRVLGRRAAALLDGLPVEGYGKGGLAGSLGEQEQVVACVTTVFGDAFREAIGGGQAWISSTTKLGSIGASIDIPLAFKDEVYVRSHYDTITLQIPDGPLPDELVICVAVSSGQRIGARVGGMTVQEVLERNVS